MSSCTSICTHLCVYKHAGVVGAVSTNLKGRKKPWGSEPRPGRAQVALRVALIQNTSRCQGGALEKKGDWGFVVPDAASRGRAEPALSRLPASWPWNPTYLGTGRPLRGKRGLWLYFIEEAHSREGAGPGLPCGGTAGVPDQSPPTAWADPGTSTDTSLTTPGGSAGCLSQAKPTSNSPCLSLNFWEAGLPWPTAL